MKLSLNLIFALLLILSAVFIVPARASVSVTGTINDNIYVVYDFENLNQTVYDDAKAQFNISTIPTIIEKNLGDQGRTQVTWGFGSQTDIFNDTTRAIHVSFYLGGSDIMNFTTDRTTMRRIYQVKTDWRKFQVNLTQSFSINFTQILAKPVEEWQKINETAYLYQSEDVSFEFVLSDTATQVKANGDTITFEVSLSLSFWDMFLNSPFLILAVLVIVIIIVLIYRRIR